MSTLADYDPWAQQVLQTLQSGAPDGMYTANYILTKDVRITVFNKEATNLWWNVKFTFKGPQIENTLYVSPYINGLLADDPWVLMEFVHETRHLEQGFWTAFSVYGEFEAWQWGFRHYKACPNCQPVGQYIEDLLNLPLSHDKNTVKQAQNLINLYENGGGTFKDQAWAVLRKEKRFENIYWINALPLNPLF